MGDILRPLCKLSVGNLRRAACLSTSSKLAVRCTSDSLRYTTGIISFYPMARLGRVYRGGGNIGGDLQNSESQPETTPKYRRPPTKKLQRSMSEGSSNDQRRISQAKTAPMHRNERQIWGSS